MSLGFPTRPIITGYTFIEDGWRVELSDLCSGEIIISM